MGSSSSRQRTRPEEQQQPSGGYTYAPSSVQQSPQYSTSNFGGYTNGQLYGGYHHAPTYGQMPPGAQLTPNIAGHYGQRPPALQYHQTQTIKNQVNLNKKTLRLQPVGNSNTEFHLHFNFDASSACRVCVFWLATERTEESCRVAASLPAGPAVYYPRGNHHFPSNDDVANQNMVSLAKHSPNLFTLAQSDSYPLIIRLETLTEQAAAEGKQLQQFELGAALPPWIQAQTTYAKLKKEDEGHWGLQILKQRIWVSGTSYELQEIYGLETKQNPSTSGEGVEGRECVICMSAERDTTVLPCRHMCMCQECADELRIKTNKCPICREEIQSLLHFNWKGRQGLAPAGNADTQRGTVSTV